MELLVKYTFGLGGRVDITEFTTDANGTFSHEYTGHTNLREIVIRIYNSASLLILYPEDMTGDTKNIGVLNMNPTANYQLKIKINNTYNAGDTLLIGDVFGTKKTKIPYPFYDTTFEVHYNYTHSLEIPIFKNKHNVFLNTYYWVYSKSIDSSNINTKKSKHYDFNFNGCSSEINNIEMLVE